MAGTGTEQLLLTGTWDNALSHVDFSALVRDESLSRPQYITVVDKDYIISSIRRTMAEQGLLLESNKDKAQNVVEVAIGAYGTDERDRKFGLPGLSIAPSLTTGATVTSSGSSTSLTFSETNQQDAVVKASLFAYEAKSGRLVWESSPLYNAQGRSRPLRDGLRTLPLELSPRGCAVSHRVGNADPEAVLAGRDVASRQ